MPHSQHHEIDFENKIAQLPYFGMPIDEFFAEAKADGWDVDVLWEDGKGGRNVFTLAVRHDHVFVQERGGKVVGFR